LERDFAIAHAEVPDRKVTVVPPEVSLKEMLLALKDVLQRADLFTHHHISREPLSIRQRMADVLAMLADGEFREFHSLFELSQGRRGIVVTFLAILEMSKEGLVEIVQEVPLDPIYVRTRPAEAES
jgi:segregation and condensation protein A